jgi:hypothetical protein
MAGDMLGARTIFEPLSPKSCAMVRLGGASGYLPRDRTSREIYMPGISVEGELEEWAARVLKRVPSGAFSDAWTQRERSGFANLMSSTVVLKEVRLSLCLPWLLENMNGCGVVHVMRDPRSVIAGILRRPGWAAGAFENIDLEKQLLYRIALCRELDQNVRDRLIEFVPGSPVEKLAAFWSATQHVALNQIGRVGGRCRVIRYEDLVCRGEDELRTTLKSMQFKADLLVNLQRGATSTADKERRNITMDARLKSWQDTLSSGQVASIEKVIDKLGMRAWVYE